MPSVSGVTIACIDTTSDSASRSSREWVASGVYGSYAMHAHPESLEPPLRRAPDRAEADEPGGAARELPGPEALVGDRAVTVRLAVAHVAVGADDAAVHGEEQRDRHLGDRVGVAPGRAQHRDALGRRGRDVDVVGVAPARADRAQREVEHRPLDRVGLDDEQVGALGRDPLRELLAVVDAQRVLLDPRVVDDVGERLERRRVPRRGTARSRARGVVSSSWPIFARS